ncbi:MAG: Ribosomal RNA small subunit methyltransferase C (EC [uncultured Thiotrichaceae bacterium]|uniref:Ribosomal RNA small subunit methyltransferase C (EC) n=1 Tax=uncultured Thiotrichaceae bacterium TaxID=298394 RepID=A0A6S6SG06_9GAMM|nr:MAG: Ribosomal RNA small subunit methyltransferase C (EC [uncultured Thiotrichaceae bacterium]
MKKKVEKPSLESLREDIVFDTTLCDQKLRLHSTWGIFSPREIDAGTALLLKYVDIAKDADCLDLGCGYGPIGLTVAKLAPQGKTLMVDKDFMAVEYSNKNAKVNNIDNAEAMLSNGFQHIEKDRRFDVVISNVPAKVGKEMMTLMLNDAKRHMKPDGEMFLVTINGLRQYMKRNLNEVFGNYKKLKQGPGYTVSYARRER